MENLAYYQMVTGAEIGIDHQYFIDETENHDLGFIGVLVCYFIEHILRLGTLHPRVSLA